MKNALETLPAHFRQALPDGKKMEFILSYGNHCRDTDGPDYTHQIELDHRKLKFTSPKEALEGIAHE